MPTDRDKNDPLSLLHAWYRLFILLLVMRRECQCHGAFSHPLLTAPSRCPTPLQLSCFTQVISDVDDTLKSSGGVAIAGIAMGGIDVQYARGEIYPGVVEFMLHISLGGEAVSQEHWALSVSNPMNTKPPPQRSQSNDPELVENRITVQSSPASPLIPAKVAILTARAEEFKAVLELKENSSIAQAFRKVGERYGIHGWGLGPVLYGSVAEWIIQDRKGLRKFTNFERLLEQDPTGSIMQYVYVGDTGELDQQAGETMLREYPEVVKAVFLHVVSKVRRSEIAIPPPKIINGRPLVFFRTYVGAALAATQLGLMTTAGLEHVMEASCEKLALEPRNSDKWMDLQRDLDRAYLLLSTY